jgi:hypothetical protein
MKRNPILALFLLLVILFSASFSARAGVTNLFNLGQTGGSTLTTNNGNTFSVPGIYIPPQKFTFQSLGLTNAVAGSYLTNGITNQLSINIQVSVDAANSNWVTLATWTPSSTNAYVDTFNPTFNAITLPMRAQIVTSNSVGVATFVTQQ